ncbi:hypothetical protein Ae201684_010593 [Aphanomyces euteiches]|uniref:Uncharacterized protein n=1 Tax=Aphanomyces euteiches TaxID=100861 RepID=A0A6G0WXP6_9STRA|nr:hypothetical protein Ae201684_010593 [Aphanomyces euteiches]
MVRSLRFELSIVGRQEGSGHCDWWGPSFRINWGGFTSRNPSWRGRRELTLSTPFNLTAAIFLESKEDTIAEIPPDIQGPKRHRMRLKIADLIRFKGCFPRGWASSSTYTQGRWCIGRPTTLLPLCIEPLHTRTWPNDLQSLKGWSFSSLLFRYWLDSLDEIPIDGSLHGQRDSRRAAAIARSILRERYPQPPGESPSETWVIVAKQLAVNVQREVLSIVHAKNPQRARTHTGAASGLIKAWRDSYLLDYQ